MTTRLTLYYTLSVFVLLAAASALLYWGLRGNLLAQDESFRGPRHRPPHCLTAIVVVMRVGDQDGVRTDARWKIISYPNAARVRIDENLLA